MFFPRPPAFVVVWCGASSRPQQEPPRSKARSRATHENARSRVSLPWDLALYRSAWHIMVLVRLGPGHARLAWSKTPLPALSTPYGPR